MEDKLVRMFQTQMQFKVGDCVQRLSAPLGEHITTKSGGPGRTAFLRTGIVIHVGWTRVEVRWENGVQRNYDSRELMPEEKEKP